MKRHGLVVLSGYVVGWCLLAFVCARVGAPPVSPQPLGSAAAETRGTGSLELRAQEGAEAEASNSLSLRSLAEGVAWYGIAQKWDYAANDLAFSGLQAASSISFGSRLFFIAGTSNGALTNTVWQSEDDGATWALGPAQQFGARQYASVVEHQGLVFLIGGWRAGAEHWSDVWAAANAENLVFEERLGHEFQGHNGTFSGRREALAVSFEQKLYLIGGTGECSQPETCYGLQQIHESDDGSYWNTTTVVGSWPSFSTAMQLTGVVAENAIYIFSVDVVARLTKHQASGGLEMTRIATLPGGYGGTFGIRGKALYQWSYLWFFPRQLSSGAIDDKILFSTDLGHNWHYINPLDSGLGNAFDLSVVEYGVFAVDGKFCIVGGRSASGPQNKMSCSTRPKFPAPSLRVLSTTAPAAVQLTRDPAPPGEALQTVYWTSWYGTAQRTNIVSSNITLLWSTRQNKLSDAITISSEVVSYGLTISPFSNSDSNSLSFTIVRRLDSPSFLYVQTVVQNGATISPSSSINYPQLNITCALAESERAAVSYTLVSGGSHITVSSCLSPCRVYLLGGTNSITASCEHSAWPASLGSSLEVVAILPNITSGGGSGGGSTNSGSGGEGGGVQNPNNPNSPAPSPDSGSGTQTPTPEPSTVYEIRACDESCVSQSCTTGGALNTEGGGAILLTSQQNSVISNVQFRSDEMGVLACQQVQTSQSVAGHCCAYPSTFGSFEVLSDQSSNMGSVQYRAPAISNVKADTLNTAGSSKVTIEGSNFGSVFVGAQQSGSGPWTVGSSTVGNGIQIDGWIGTQTTEHRMQSLQWVSDSMIVATAPPGIGKDLSIVLHVGDHQPVTTKAGANSTVRYTAPVIISVEPSLSPMEGEIPVTISGSSFGVSSSVVEVFFGTKKCDSVTWRSDSKVVCLSPEHEGVDLQVSVYVGGQEGALKKSFAYTESSPFISIVVGETVADLTTPGTSSWDASKTRLDDFKTWLHGILFLSSPDQVYISRVESVTARRQGQAAKIWMQLLGSATDPDRYEGDIANLYFLANSADGFKESGLNVKSIKIPGNPEIVLEEPQAIPTEPIEIEDSGGSSNTIIIVLATACSALFVALILTFLCLKRRFYLVIAENRSMPETPSRQGLLRPPLNTSAGSISSRVETVYMASPSAGNGPDPVAEEVYTPSSGGEGPGFGDDICDQCRRSGFRFCVHRMGGQARFSEPIPSAPELSSLSEGVIEELCVVCMDAPREAIVVHDDEKKTTHQVLCLECSYRVIEDGAPCPLCRGPILAVFNARTGADVT